METVQDKPAVLLLEDGTVFYGKAAGAIGTTTGEIAFNTGMTGYQEIFTDPSYYGQILVMAAAHLGNYGVHTDEVESEHVKIAGMVCKRFSENFSRPAAECGLQEYFQRDGTVAICDVDTRALIRHIRHKGAMNAIISSETTDIDILRKQLEQVPSMNGLELSSRVTCNEAYTTGDPASSVKVALLDLGCKRNIITCLTDRGCFVKVFPMHASVAEILDWQPDGIMISNGPGDPAAMSETVDKTKELINSEIPVFGICMGHQIIGLSQGLRTEKMFNGHRGINHPVKNLLTGKAEITSQNHGFHIVAEGDGDENVQITHRHLNDGSVAGLALRSKPVFSVQYHPESSAGPHDSRYLFDQFVQNIKEYQQQRVS